MSGIDDFGKIIEGYVQRLGKKERRELLRKIGMDVRREQANRIAEQKNADGTGYVPRRPRREVRKKAMFSKIKMAKFMRISVGEGAVSVGYSGIVSKVATVHQLGLVDSVDRNRRIRHRYDRREILGVSKNTERVVERDIIDHMRRGE